MKCAIGLTVGGAPYNAAVTVTVAAVTCNKLLVTYLLIYTSS